ncbi:MAG: four helix bundle suffix domain-containing protein [Bacteroidales bacterium]|nr:four helix bundle suffix domain-containing protein [Bacteroidales bacterium]
MEQLIPNHGNYKKLLSYQKTNVIFCLTYYFVEHYLQKGDRTYDQMLQAARSGKQNIIEGSAASSTSAKTEIKLVNVAKASLQELLEDFEDYLKTRGHRQWEEGSVELETMRELGKNHSEPEFFMSLAETRPPETIANMCIVLIKQADYLLYKQLQRLSTDFMKEGGFSERMFRLRSQQRDSAAPNVPKDSRDPRDPKVPKDPKNYRP